MSEAELEHVRRLFVGCPCDVRVSAELGRHLVATRDILAGEEILTSTAVLTGLLPSWKKRVCRCCFTTHTARLEVSCRCQTFYCSEACREAHATGASDVPGSRLPHALVCPVLQLFAACKADAEMQSVLFMCLDAFAARDLAGGEAAQRSFHDTLLLQSHEADFDAKDRREWLKATQFLIQAMRRAGWAGELPKRDEVMALVGRIAANNFGMWLAQQRPPNCGNGAPNPQVQASSPAEASAAAREAARAAAVKPGAATAASEMLRWPMQGGQADHEPAAAEDSVRHLGGRLAGLDIEPAEQREDACSSRAESLAGSADSDGGTDEPGSPETAPAQPDGRQTHEVCIGRELYISASLLNHSCLPSCVLNRPFSGRRGQGGHEPAPSTAVVTSLRDVKAGEELTISYIDLEQPVSARRHALEAGFFFACQCIRCREELKSGSGKLSHARSAQGGQGKDYAPKRRGRKARASR